MGLPYRFHGLEGLRGSSGGTSAKGCPESGSAEETEGACGKNIVNEGGGLGGKQRDGGAGIVPKKQGDVRCTPSNRLVPSAVRRELAFRGGFRPYVLTGLDPPGNSHVIQLAHPSCRWLDSPQPLVALVRKLSDLPLRFLFQARQAL